MLNKIAVTLSGMETKSDVRRLKRNKSTLDSNYLPCCALQTNIEINSFPLKLAYIVHPPEDGLSLIKKQTRDAQSVVGRPLDVSNTLIRKESIR